MGNKKLIQALALATFLGITTTVLAQITERPRPVSWEQLVPGARFMDRFLPMQGSRLVADSWGAKGVKLRLADNGIESRIWSFWGGNIVKADDGKYHLMVCGWLESSPAGHMEWSRSYVFNTVSDTPYGPFELRNMIGRGHNPEVYRLLDGRYVLYVIDGCYVTDNLNGKWQKSKLTFDSRDRNIVEGLSNLSFARRSDGSFLMVCRGGGIWVSRDGFHFSQVSNESVYPKVDGRFEDPVVWKDSVQYNLIVNDWYGRIAYYLRSANGIDWTTDAGEAYMPGIARHADGKKEDWFKYERPKVLQDEYGRAVQANFAVIDTLKFADDACDNHSSKNITIPLNPGLLLHVEGNKKIDCMSRDIRVKVSSEKHFAPYSDLDIASLRLGAPTEVDYGRGCLVKKHERVGNDLILTFDGKGNGLTSNDFVLKLIGKKKDGSIAYGYARLPQASVHSPLLSARAPRLTADGNCRITVENFGLETAEPSTVCVEYTDGKGRGKMLGSAEVSALKPYESTEVYFKPAVSLTLGKMQELGKVSVILKQNRKAIGRAFITPIHAPQMLQEATTLTSPNGKLTASLSIPTISTGKWGIASLAVSFAHQGQTPTQLMSAISLGLKTNQRDFSRRVWLIAVSDERKITDDYVMITGKRSHCVNHGVERTYTFENDKKQLLQFTLRVYNDGVAFRYQLPQHIDATKGKTEILLSEHTTYNIPQGTKRWMQTYDPTSYERFYPLITDGSLPNESKKFDWGYPSLIEAAQEQFVLITEAGLRRDHAASYLNNKVKPHQYQVTYGDKSLPIKAGYTSPWRVLITGTMADIVESTLVTDVSDPSEMTSTDWIKPAPASWIYWVYNHGSKDYKIVKEYADLAVDMKWPYLLIDWEWDVMGNGGNIDDALRYCHEHKVSPLLWYNSSTNWIGKGAPGPLYKLNTPDARRKEMTWLKEKGVAGIKVDFFKGDDVKSVNYYLDLLEEAARQRLLITFHGATVPRGWQRTYPHLMTVEAVYGAEWYNNAKRLGPRAAAHNCTLVFTRNVIGPMDYTPGTFSDSQHPHFTTHGHELALPILFESALQHMPDRPSVYRSLPKEVKQLLSQLPTAWDETRLLNGYPDHHVVMARRKGNAWYVAGINGTESAQELKMNLKQLGLEGRTATLMADGQTPHSFRIETLKVTASIQVSTLPRGGFVLLID